MERWLDQKKRTYCATFDLHETRPDYRGEGFIEDDNPRECYLYETCLDPEKRIGEKLIQSLPPSFDVCKWPKIYLDDNTAGVVYYPDACRNPVYMERTTFDAYLNGRHTEHSFTFETPTGWKLEKRVEAHLTWLDAALRLL
jgi:hypothetical protein